MGSPTARSLNWLRMDGWTAGVVEKWIPQARKRRDLYGFADIAAIKAGERGTLYVQATSGSNHAARRTKLLACAEVAIALSADNRVEVWSWRKGGRAQRPQWILRREPITLSDFVTPWLGPATHDVPRETKE